MKRKEALTVIVFIVFMSVAHAAEPLSVEIKCQEYDMKIVSGWYEVHPNAGDKITLTAYSGGGIGNREYLWIENNKRVCDSISCSVTVSEEKKEYLLLVSDNLGSVKTWIRIIPKLPQKCLPKFRSDISLSDDLRRKEWSAGDKFELRIRLDKSDCSNPDYKFYWESDNSNVVFSDPSSVETEVELKKGIRTGSVDIRAVLLNDFQEKRKEITIKIVDNTPPKIVSIEYDKPLSYTRFNVYIGAESGKFGNENNDFIQCLVFLKDEQGRIVDDGYKTIKSGDFNFVFQLKPRGRGIYSIEAILKDSHGTFSLPANETFKVEKGNTGKDIPIIFTPDTIYCKQGEECEIDARDTWVKDRSVSTFGYFENGKELLNKNGSICSGSIGSFVFDYPRTYRIEIRAKYFGNDNFGSKIISVIVESNNSATPTQTPMSTQTSTTIMPTQKHTAIPKQNLPYQEYQPIPTPGTGTSTAIVIIILAIAFRKRNQT